MRHNHHWNCGLYDYYLRRTALCIKGGMPSTLQSQQRSRTEGLSSILAWKDPSTMGLILPLKFNRWASVGFLLFVHSARIHIFSILPIILMVERSTLLLIPTHKWITKQKKHTTWKTDPKMNMHLINSMFLIIKVTPHCKIFQSLRNFCLRI